MKSLWKQEYTESSGKTQNTTQNRGVWRLDAVDFGSK